ncbi:unnamed protein product [Pleuronectes platessa]|uniref:Uncharacterized protein n=1 Tax=Pleuronectes platessa TaxID=8262 RepID=A0A9N7YR80_PLEPL|nr:unnamed protein product [Pleuronectes platessa]
MVNLPPVGGLVPTRDEPNEGGVIRELKEFDGLVTGAAEEDEEGGLFSCERKPRDQDARGVFVKNDPTTCHVSGFPTTQHQRSPR